MVYKKRLDGRKLNELRPVTAKAGVIKNAQGSSYFKIGNTEAYAAVYGPKNLYPKFLQDPTKGTLRCHYNMMPFSGMGDRVRPGQNRRAKEISMVTEKALAPVVMLDKFPNSVVDVFIELPSTDAGSRCAGICAASIALADAGIPMKDLVAAVASGLVDKSVVIDLDYEEEHYPEFATEKVEDEDVADIPVAVIPSTGEISLLQMDGIVDKKELIDAIELVKSVAPKIYEIQKNALAEKFKSVEEMDGADDE